MGRALRWIGYAVVGASVFYWLVAFVARTEPTFPPPYAVQGRRAATALETPPPPATPRVTSR